MKRGLFLNMAALYPVAELHFSQKHKLNENSYAYQCFGELKQCHINPFGRKAICKYCISRANTVVKGLNLPVIPIVKTSKEIYDNKIINKIEQFVMSSISSITRCTDRDELNSTWIKVHKNLLSSSINIYHFFINEFNNGLDELLMFNGRFCWDGAAKYAAMNLKKDFIVYDFKKSNSYYEFKNISLHSISENHNRAINFYIRNPKSATRVAEEFIESKILGIPTYEKSYTELQQKDKISVAVDENKKLITVFPSSDDEYKYIGHEWGASLVNCQANEIRDLISGIDNTKYQVIVRLHPNMNGLSSKALSKYFFLEKTFCDIKIIPPNDITSTYTLLEKSDIVICFCSTIATEANYKRKKVICIGGTPFMKLRIANYVNSGKDASNLIANNRLKIGVKRASIIWFYYLWKYNDYNDLIFTSNFGTCDRDQLFKFSLNKSAIYRLLQSPFRAEIELRKPSKKDLNYWKRFIQSVKDILQNKFSLKT